MEPTTASIVRLVLGDQLDERHSWFAEGPNPEALVVMMEIRPETETVTHHIQKLLAVFGAMRRFASRLQELGHRAHHRLENFIQPECRSQSLSGLCQRPRKVT